jgi:DNA polymerase
MDARDALRRFLEQRKELGESEFVLDSMSVGDALRILGAGGGSESAPIDARSAIPPQPVARRSEPRAAPVPPPVPQVRERAPAGDENWREVLRAAGAAPAEPPAPAPPTPAAPVAPGPKIPRYAFPTPPGADAAAADAPPGLVVGTASTELFDGPFAAAATIDALSEMIAACTRCPLHATALNPVPGEGNPSAELVCVGEAPGETEDRTGRPFVGAAGQLLTRILEGGMQIPREQVFICNVLKHRPPGNRNPAPDEIVACRPFLLRQLELLRPRVILALGTFAAQTLLETKLAIGKLRGQVHTFYGIPLVVTYHPAALLRNPGWKRPTYDDVKLARRLLDRPRTGA